MLIAASPPSAAGVLPRLDAVPSRVAFKPHHVRRAVSGSAKRRLVLCNRTAAALPYVLQPPATGRFTLHALCARRPAPAPAGNNNRAGAGGLQVETRVEQKGGPDDYAAPALKGVVPAEGSVALVVRFTPPAVGEADYLYSAFQDSFFAHLPPRAGGGNRHSVVEVRLTALCDPPGGAESKGSGADGTSSSAEFFPATTQLSRRPPTSVYPTPEPEPPRLTQQLLAETFGPGWAPDEYSTRPNADGAVVVDTDLRAETRGGEPEDDDPLRNNPELPRPVGVPESKNSQPELGCADDEHPKPAEPQRQSDATSTAAPRPRKSDHSQDELAFYRQHMHSAGGTTTAPAAIAPVPAGTAAPPRPRPRVARVARVECVEDAKSIVERMRMRHRSSAQKRSFSRTLGGAGQAIAGGATTTTMPTSLSSSSSSGGTGISLAEFDSIVSSSAERNSELRRSKSALESKDDPAVPAHDHEELAFYQRHMAMDTQRRNDRRQRGRVAAVSSNPYRDLVDASNARTRAAQVDRQIALNSPHVARLAELSRSPNRNRRGSPLRTGRLQSRQDRKRRGRGKARRGRRAQTAPALPRAGEFSDFHSTLQLPDYLGEDGEDHLSHSSEEEGDGRGGPPGFQVSVTDKLEWQTLRAELTIAELNARRRNGQTGLLRPGGENPEDDATSSSEDEGTDAPLAAPVPVVRDQDEMQFYHDILHQETQREERDASKVSGGEREEEEEDAEGKESRGGPGNVFSRPKRVAQEPAAPIRPEPAWRNEELEYIVTNALKQEKSGYTQVVGGGGVQQGPPSPLLRAVMADQADDALLGMAVQDMKGYEQGYEQELRKALREEL